MSKYFRLLVLGILIVCVIVFWFLRLSSNYNISIVEGESMAPTLNTGDLIITKSLKGQVKPGMIIEYQYDKMIILHRVISIDGQIIITEGDANEEPDPWQVSTSDIKGIYLLKIPYLGYLSIIKPFWKISLCTLLIGILAGFLIIYEISDKKSTPRGAFRSLRKGGKK